jgi:hypothetical protein
MFYAGPHLRVDRPTRAAIFDSLGGVAWVTLRHMQTLNQHRFATAWRFAARSWLRCQALITVSSANQNQATNDHKNQPLSSHFSKKWSH